MNRYEFDRLREMFYGGPDINFEPFKIDELLTEWRIRYSRGFHTDVEGHTYLLRRYTDIPDSFFIVAVATRRSTLEEVVDLVHKAMLVGNRIRVAYELRDNI